MKMSRGAFYKYFDDLEDAHTYIVKKYSAIIHHDLLKYVQQADLDFFVGIRYYFTWCIKLEKETNYWKGLVLLTRTNHQRTMRHNHLATPSPHSQKWHEILKRNHYQVHSEEEANHLFFFLSEMVIDSLASWIVNEWTTEAFLTDFDYRVKWLTQGLLQEKKEDETQ